METLPRLAPVLRNFGSSARTEGLPEALLSASRRIRGQFEVAIDLEFLESLREELEHRRASLLGTLGWDANREAAELRRGQRNAARSFSKKPSSGL